MNVVFSPSWRLEMTEKAVPSVRMIARAMSKGIDPESHGNAAPLISIIRKMKGEGADAELIKAILSLSSEMACDQVLPDTYRIFNNSVNRTICKIVDRQFN